MNLGIQWSGHRRTRGSGRPAAPLPSPPRQPWFSGARRKCEPALLASLLACCSTNPPNPHFCTPRAPPLSTSALSDSKREGAVGAQGCRPAKQVSQRPPALTPGERAERPQVGSLHPRVRGAGGGERPRGAAAPDGLKLTGGHRGAGQAGVAGRCHRRAPRATLLAQPQSGRRRRCPGPAARSLRGPQPMAKSGGRAESTSLRTLPALPAPPDDALLPPLFICGFRPSRRLRTLFSGCRG